MAELIWRYRETIRTGRLLYAADNPRRVQLTTAFPRLILQCIFLTLAGRLLSGQAGAQYAFTGTVAYAACTRTIVFVCDIPMIDKLSDSYYRLQAGSIEPGAVYLCRTLPYLVSGIVSSLVALIVAGPVLGLAHVSLSLLPLLPIYVLIACTTTAFGLAVAGLAVGGSRDILFGNLASYLILAAAGIVTPYPRDTHWLAQIGYFIPVSHGLSAIRAQLAGHPWGGQVLLEAAVGAGWLVAAVLILWIRDRKVRGGSMFRLLRRLRRPALRP